MTKKFKILGVLAVVLTLSGIAIAQSTQVAQLKAQIEKALGLTTGVLHSNGSGVLTSSGVVTGDITDGTITTSDLSASAGILGSQLAANPSFAGTVLADAVRGSSAALFGFNNSTTNDDTLVSSATPSTYGNALLVLLPTGTSGSGGANEWAVCLCRLGSGAYCSTVAVGSTGECVSAPTNPPVIANCTDTKACIGYDGINGTLVHYNRTGTARATRAFMIGH